MKFDTVAPSSDSIGQFGEPSSSIVKRKVDMTLTLRRKNRTGIRYARTLLYVAMNVACCAVMRGQTAQYDSRHAALMEMQIPSLIKVANAGSTDAEILLGERYLTGSGCKKDAATAAVWWRKAASKGNVQAYDLLGKLYESDALGKPDYAESLYWYGMSSQAPPTGRSIGQTAQQLEQQKQHEEDRQRQLLEQTDPTGRPVFSARPNQLSESLSVTGPSLNTVPVQPAVQQATGNSSSGSQSPRVSPPPQVYSVPPPAPPPPPDDDEKAEKIADLQRQYQELEDDANIIENSVEQYGQCTGMFSAICDAHNAKELRKAKEDRQEMEKIRRKLAALGAGTEPDQ